MFCTHRLAAAVVFVGGVAEAGFVGDAGQGVGVANADIGCCGYIAFLARIAAIVVGQLGVVGC